MHLPKQASLRWVIFRKQQAKTKAWMSSSVSTNSIFTPLPKL